MLPTLLLLLLIALLGTMLVTYLTRGTAIKRIRLAADGIAIPPVHSAEYDASFQLLTDTTLHKGNHIELLLNGDGTYHRLCEDLRRAEQLITLHVFFYKPGQLAEQVREILIERAQAGVKVLLLFDAFGSRGIGNEYANSLKAAGVEVATFRPLRWKNLYKVQQRMHVRSIIIDGRLGYTGGFAIDDKWLGDGRHQDQLRDTNVRVQGPVVNQLQAAFSTNWAEATGDMLMGEAVFPTRESRPDGDSMEAGIMHCSPSLGSTHAERFFVLSIVAARQRLYITNAYFVPDRDFRRLLIEAAGRGVDVRVLTPGANTDRPSAWHAARAHYEDLIRGGVRIYEYRPTMVHAKTIIIDGTWASVGTFNFDNRSMKLNDEVALIIRSQDFGARLEALFLEDIRYADEVTLESIRERSWQDRLKEQAARMVAPIL